MEFETPQGYQIMKKILNSTAECKAHLVTIFPELAVNGWKRVRKFKHKNGWSYRTFANGDTWVIVVTDSDNGLRKVYPQGVLQEEDLPIVQAIIDAAKKIKHCGDYGDIYYNPASKEVWGCYGDGDFSDNTDGPTTSADEAEQLLKVPGVRKVRLEGECSPDTDNPEERSWVDLGRYGIEVYYNYKTEKYEEHPIK